VKYLCLNCGRELRKLLRHCDKVPASLADDKDAILRWLVAHPQDRDPWQEETPVAVGRVRRNVFDHALLSVNYHTGRYGNYGDNRFCGQACGWRWAIKQRPAPRTAEEA
jgi:hypothetical protein